MDWCKPGRGHQAPDGEFSALEDHSSTPVFVARYKLFTQMRPEYFSDPVWMMQLAIEVSQTVQ